MSTQPTAAPAASPPCRANSSRGQPDYVRFIMYLAGPDISGTSSGFLGALRPSCNCNEQFSRVRVNGRNVPHGLTRLVLRKRHHKLDARGRMCWLTDSAKAVYSEAQHNSQPVSQTAMPPNDGIRTLRAQALDSQRVPCGYSVLGVSPCVSNQPTRPPTFSTC